MEERVNELLKRLKDKQLQLIAYYEKTQREYRELLAENQKNKDEIRRQYEVIRELEEKNKKLQLAEAFKGSSADTNDAKLKIGRIVKEIDKCIALLNR
jgi:predicted  nucleic acid-binding Zn-ribbon protein